MLVVTVPILFPMVTEKLGYDLVWFGVLVVTMMQLANLTPPYGVSLFAIAGIAKDVPMTTIFRGESRSL
jgi:TRAP-type mannitol/chloroaromatic compound transport system permease large subunit